MKKKALILFYFSGILMIANMVSSSFAKEQETQELELLMQTYTNDRYYDRVCWLTSHNSFAYNCDETNSIKHTNYIRPNQILTIKGQLEYGVRGFMVDLYKNKDETKPIILSHRRTETSWDNYDQDFVYPFLQTIKEWLNDPKNADDIITLHLESYVRSYKRIIEVIDALDARDRDKNVPTLKSYLFDLCEYNGGNSEVGVAERAWPHGKRVIKWPTLGEMRRMNKRLVIFSDKVEDVGYGIMYVSNIMETQYDLSQFPICEKRLEGRVQKAPVFIMNHFYAYLSVPGLGWFYDDEKTNRFDTLLLRTGACCFQENLCPNFIAIDNVGSKDDGARRIVLAINEHNKICYCAIPDVTSSDIETKIESKTQGNREYPKQHEDL